MAENNPFIAPEQVYRGREGTGAAQVFGMPANPLDTWFKIQGNKAAQAQALAEQEQKLKAQRDKQINEMFEWNPEKPWEPFNQQINQLVQGYRTSYIDRLYKGGASPELSVWSKTAQDEINDVVRKSNFLQGKYTGSRNIWHGENKKYFDSAYYDTKLNDLYYNSDGTPKPMLSIDWMQGDQIINDAKGYKINEIAGDFVKNLAVKQFGDWDLASSSMGDMKVSNNFQSKIFQHDPETKELILDENGLPKLNLTQEVRAMALQDPLISNYVNYIAEQPDNKLSKDDILKQVLTPHDPLRIGQKVGGTNRYPTGRGNESPTYQLSKGSDVNLRSASEIGEGNVAGGESIIMRTPNLVPGTVILDTSEDSEDTTPYSLEGFERGSDGNKYIMVSFKLPGGIVPQTKQIPYNEDNLNLFRNAIKNKKGQDLFDKAIGDFEDGIKGAETYYRDNEKLNKVINNLSEVVPSFIQTPAKGVMGIPIKVDDLAGLKESIATLFSENNIPFEPEVKISSWKSPGQPYIKIGSEEFYLPVFENGKNKFSRDDSQRLKDYIYDSAKSQFVTKGKKQEDEDQPEQNPLGDIKAGAPPKEVTIETIKALYD